MSAERAQRRELPGALGDGDRKRVGDHEAADEECHAGEGQEELLEEADELVRIRGVFLSRFGARRDLPRPAEGSAGSWSSSCGSLTPGFAATAISSSFPCWRRGAAQSARLEAGERRAADRGHKYPPEIRRRGAPPVGLRADLPVRA